VDVLTALRRQAQACADLGSPMYADLLSRVAADVDRGGVFAHLLAAGDSADPWRSALGLRLLGAVHRLVLDGTATGLAAYYPSAGGEWRSGPGWPALVEAVEAHADAVRARLPQPPQTNEVGRAAALLGGLAHVAERDGMPVRLHEIGASGGLNLRADHFCCLDDRGGVHGRADSPVRLHGAWTGRLPPSAQPEVVGRRGCDTAPVDASTEDGRLTLSSYVWPDQRERWQRLQAALDVAADVPVDLSRQSASDFVKILRLTDGASTVLWHSVMWQYLDDEEQRLVADRVRALGAEATPARPFAHLLMEPLRRPGHGDGDDPEFLVVLRHWPGGERRVLGRAEPHGVPTTWE
jgi:hypothetical protein